MKLCFIECTVRCQGTNMDHPPGGDSQVPCMPASTETHQVRNAYKEGGMATGRPAASALCSERAALVCRERESKRAKSLLLSAALIRWKPEKITS